MNELEIECSDGIPLGVFIVGAIFLAVILLLFAASAALHSMFSAIERGLDWVADWQRRNG